VEQTIVGIDVGTTKICTLVGHVGEKGMLQIVGVGVAPAEGIRKGVITDIEAATRSIGESVSRAERVSGYTIAEAYVSVGGSHIASQNSRGLVAIGRGDRPVDRDDIERAMEAAQAVAVPHNRRIIHSLPREFIIDGHDGIRNPLGLMGYRLEVEAHIVTGAVTSLQNLVHCVNRNNIQVTDLVLQPLASAEAVLTEEERTLGVAVLDIGGGTMDMAVFVDGTIWETVVFDLGGNHLTNDIAVGLRTPLPVAEDIKIRYAHSLPDSIDDSEVVEVATFGAESLQKISRRELCRIVSYRIEEMLEIVAREVRRSGYDSLLPAGVVLTGGTANLRGVQDVAGDMFRLPVRVGTPRRLQGLIEAISNPAYATSVGLLLWGQRGQQAVDESIAVARRSGTLFERVLTYLRVFLPRG
jgi:cell division protein FtsA